MALVPAAYYDADYYQRGTLTGRSCYDAYRWMPETSVRWFYGDRERVGIIPDDAKRL